MKHHRIIKTRRSAAVVGVVSIAFISAACSSTASGGSSSSSSSQGVDSSSSSATGGGTSSAGSTGKINGSNVTLGFVALNNQPFSLQIAQGVEAAAAEYGAKVKSSTPSQQDASSAVSNFQNLTTAGVQGIIVTAFPGDQWTKPIATAIKQGILVNSVDASSPQSGTSFHVGPPRQQMSAAIATELVKSFPNGKDSKGTVVAGICVAGVPEFDALAKGLRTKIAELAPGVKVIDVATGTSNAASFAAWQRIVPQNPDALAFVGFCDPDLPALVKLKQSAPGSKWLSGMTTGGENPVGWTAIPAGNLTIGMSQRGFVEGYVAAKLTLQKLVDGKAEPKGWIDSGVDLMTKDTVAAVSKALSSPEAAKAYYAGLLDKLTNNPQTFPDQAAEQTMYDQPMPQHDGTGVKQ